MSQVVEIDGYRFIKVRLRHFERYYNAMKRFIDYVTSFPYDIDTKEILDFAEYSHLMDALYYAREEGDVDVDYERPLAPGYCIDDTSHPEECKVVFFSEDYKGVMLLKPEVLIREDQRGKRDTAFRLHT